MRKIYLLHIVAIVLTGSLIGTSCKKPLHSNNPTNNNSRLSGYTKLITITPVSTGIAGVVTESYQFFYDGQNRVSQILFTNNDSTNTQQSSAFVYSSDSVFKTTTNVLTHDTIEIDTFIYNATGQLAKAYTPNLITTFDYYGRLLATYTMIGRDNKGNTATAVSTYTSVNGDLLMHNYNGNLVANMSSNRTAPFNATWTYYLTTMFGSGYYGTTSNSPTAGSSFTLSNYTEAPVRLTTKDYNNVEDTLYFPGELWRKESYHFYTEMANRIGDYLTIQSFTMYGTNIYQDVHLVESISSINRHANISYSIDAHSNITQARVVTLDSVLNSYNTVYNYQYEVY